MNQVILTTMNWLNLSAIFDVFYSMRKSIERNREVNRTIKELSALSNRELNDIGISRSDIRAVAEGIF